MSNWTPFHASAGPTLMNRVLGFTHEILMNSGGAKTWGKEHAMVGCDMGLSENMVFPIIAI